MSRCSRHTSIAPGPATRSEEHTSELQSQSNLVCRLLLEKKNTAWVRTSLVTTQGAGLHRCRFSHGESLNGAGVVVGLLSVGFTVLLLYSLTFVDLRNTRL